MIYQAILVPHSLSFPSSLFTLHHSLFIYFARLNPSGDQSEIKNLQTHQTELEEALAETRFRLDSLHLVVCEN